jgi:hypothetical protein
MTGLMQRIFRRRATGSEGRGRFGLLSRRSGESRLPWGSKAAAPPGPTPDGGPASDATQAEVLQAAADGRASFRDRGRLRRRLRFLRRARELAYRDIGGLTYDMRRFGRNRPDLLEAKLGALYAVDQELRALERALDDRRPIHELREPGISSCARCGALHSSDSNYCPHCGLPLGGSRAMGEVGGAIAPPPRPAGAPAASPPGPVGAPSQAAAPSAPPPPAQPTERLRPPPASDA